MAKMTGQQTRGTKTTARTRRHLAVVAFLTVATLLVCIDRLEAREFSLLGGPVVNTGTGDVSESWQLVYSEELGEHFGASFSYINEGHLPQNHRDGDALQLWARTTLLDRRLALSAGAGAYFFFNTTKQAPVGEAYTNEHGFGTIFSLAATWHTESRWLLQLRSSYIATDDSFDSLTTVFGIGYEFASPRETSSTKETSPQRAVGTTNEITLFAGQAIVNSFDSQHATAAALEYRCTLLPYLEWTAGFLYEGDNPLLKRYGLTTQVWAVREFLHEMLSLGVGGGAYLAFEHDPGQEVGTGKSSALAALLTFSASYRLNPPWYLRASWNRVITDYDRDTDVILGGVGYRF